jgi:hypothetical protein
MQRKAKDLTRCLAEKNVVDRSRNRQNSWSMQLEFRTHGSSERHPVGKWLILGGDPRSRFDRRRTAGVVGTVIDYVRPADDSMRRTLWFIGV